MVPHGILLVKTAMKASSIFCVLACAIVHQVSAIHYAPVVRVRGGRVRGLVQAVDNGKSVLGYYGIPYGKAARFEKPTYTSWPGVLNATHYREACPQNGLNEESPFGVERSTTQMSENCLYLSIWRPRPNFVTDFMLGGAIIPTRRVLVFFVGEDAYQKGTIFSPLADAKNLVSRGEIVAVVVQYRTGPFGFLYGGTKDAPGNLGLHDQLFALRWIYYNIARFSGDHNHITIAGSSSGAMSVGSLILSPLNYRLFRRAILQSGSPLSIYGATSKTEALAKTESLAVKVGCPVENINATLSCLRNRTVDEILSATKDAFIKNEVFLPIWGDEVLPLKPSVALSKGKFNLNFDLLYGVNRDEGANYVSLFVPDEMNLSIESTKEAIKWMFSFYGQNFGEEVSSFYTRDLNATATKEDLKSVIAKVWSDYVITCPTVLFAENYAKKSPRKYYYSYRLDQPFTNLLHFSNQSVIHSQELMYLFAGPGDKRFTQTDLKLSKDMLQAWISFTKIGWIRGWYGKIAWARAFDKPTEPVTKFMSLDTSNYKMVEGHYKETCNEFWEKKLFDDVDE